MSNIVQEYYNNRTPEVEALYDAYRRGEVDIFGNRRDAPGYSLGTSQDNPNLTNTSVIGNPGATTENIITDSSPNSDGDNILSETSNAPLTSMFELNNLYKEILGRDFTDGDEIFNYYSKMSPEAVREELYDSPEAQIYRQAGDSLSLANRTELLGEVTGGLLNTEDSNLDGVVNINDLLFDMGKAGYGEELPVIGTAGDNTQTNDAQVENVTTNTGFGNTSMVNALAPYYQNLVRMQITPGSNILDAPVSGNFFGIDPTTNQVGILSDPTNTDIRFRSGASGFTEQKPTGFEFGIPAFIADVPMYLPKGYENFLEEQKAEEAEAKQNRYVFSGMGADFDQSRLNETYTKD